MQVQETGKIKRLFAAAVALTVLIIATEYILLSRFIESQHYAADMINISGKQRMLSQRMALWAERLADSHTQEQRKEARAELNALADRMMQAHEILTNPQKTMGKVTHDSDRLQEIYFHTPIYLDQQVRQYVMHVRSFASLPDAMTHLSNTHLDYILNEASTPLLEGFESAVLVYRDENANELTLLKILSVGVFTVALAVIASLWGVVFRPMLRKINDTLQLMKLQQRVAVAANEAESIAEGLQAGIDSICEYTGWPVGHAFIYSTKKKALVSSGVWQIKDTVRYLSFRQGSEHIAFAPGEGFIGEVYNDATPMWILDVEQSEAYKRKEEAMKAGLRTAFAFPIFVGRKAVAVMEFYSPEAGIPDETLLHAMAHVGKQLGQAIERAHFNEKAVLLQTAIDSANDSIIIMETKAETDRLEITYANDAFSRMSGYASNEILGQSPDRLWGEFTKQETLKEMRSAMQEGRAFKDELLYYRKDGQTYWVESSVVPVKDKSGAITHYASIDHDITTRKQNEIESMNMMVQIKRANLKAEAAARDLQVSLKKAEEANKAKSDFLANMSHELRTPMNGVLGMAQLMADTPLNAEQREFIGTINSSAENLLMLLNDILDFSKIEAGALVLEHVPFPLAYTLTRTADLLRVQADRKGIELRMDCDSELPAYIWGDPGRLRQVVTNLLGNAIKFTETGYVCLHARREEKADGAVFHISVEDTGVGIAPEKLHEIFDKFTQADASITRKYGGTGLGLAITRQLVTVMGGEIWVKSEPGRGSTFHVTLPCQPANHEEVYAHEEKRQMLQLPDKALMEIGHAKALLVEDYPVNRVFAEKLLRKFGFVHIDVAENGAEALQKYRQQSYDIIFMDCQMPELDGYQATERLRILEEGSKTHTPIIAMTANAMVGDREKCLKAGMDDYLSKPLRADHLKKILLGYFVMEESRAQIITPSVLETPTEQAPVNMEQLRMFTNGDPQEERELFTLFLSQAHDILEVLRHNTAAGSKDAWKSAAHRFKGSSGNLGAMQLHQLCKHAEIHFEDAEPQKLTMLTALLQETKRVQDYLGA